MNNILIMLEKLIPDGIELFRIRYTILQMLREYQPIGRRGLTALSTYSERTVRAAIEVLNKEGLIDIAHSGMMITESGMSVLEELYPIVKMLQALPDLEEAVRELFEAKKVVIVAGNVDEDKSVKGEIGRAGAMLIGDLLEDDYTLSITGGSTIAKMVEVIPDKLISKKNLTVIPARGTIGKRMEFQASTLAVAFAKKLDATYEVLNIPDNLSKASIETIKQEPHIEKTLQKMAKSDMIIVGLGNAIKMATRRHESKETLEILEEKGAIAEAFRYYFDKDGQVVHSMTNVGLDLELALKIPKRVILAGGESKAMALMATKMLLKDSYLVIDEAAARAIINYQK